MRETGKSGRRVGNAEPGRRGFAVAGLDRVAMTLTELAPAKLNLALHVRARRADGYHELDTLFTFVTDGDRLTVEPSNGWQLRIIGPFSAGLDADKDNLVTAAADAFAAEFGVSTKLSVILEKHLPIASGIGGGSADAAAMLRLLARMNGVALDNVRLLRVAESLGSDLPVCLAGVTALAQGRGEQMTRVIGLPGAPVLLVNPGVPVSTAAVFRAWDGIDRGPLPGGEAEAIARKGRNDLQPAALALAPVIGDVLEALAADGSATLVRMSGSGATCFALFTSTIDRDRVAARIRTDRPDWWLLPTTLA